jgi:membrane protease YdiL (CAAX protease family)
VKGNLPVCNTSNRTSQVVRKTCLMFFIIISLWTLSWFIKVQIDIAVPWFLASAGSFIYWTSAKLLIWILPAIWLIRISSRRMQEVINFTNHKQWLLWGGGLGFLIALTGFIPTYLQRGALLPTQFSFALVNALFISPVFEEFLLRGAILGNLRLYYSFPKANILTSLMFVGLHLPGWTFMGDLVDNLTRPVGGVLSVFLISLVFGYAVKRSDSVMAGIIAHFLNNLA